MSATTHAPDVYRMSLKDACRAFGVSYTVLYEAVKAGEIANAIQPMRSWLVRPEDVEAWLVDLHEAKS